MQHGSWVSPAFSRVRCCYLKAIKPHATFAERCFNLSCDRFLRDDFTSTSVRWVWQSSLLPSPYRAEKYLSVHKMQLPRLLGGQTKHNVCITHPLGVAENDAAGLDCTTLIGRKKQTAQHESTETTSHVLRLRYKVGTVVCDTPIKATRGRSSTPASSPEASGRVD